MPRAFILFLLVCGLVTAGRAAPSLEDAIALYQKSEYTQARAMLEQVIAAQPNNAEACYYMALIAAQPADAAAFESAVKWISRAIQLDPRNSKYEGTLGGDSLQLAGKTRSYSDAMRGREAMEKAIALDPNNLDAREGLMQFYTEAPWPIGSSSKAQTQIEEIRKRDYIRGTALMVQARTTAKDYAAAFRLCDEVLAKHPDDYTGLFQYGRTAAISGEHLERGLACLQKCLTLPTPSPAAAPHTNVWMRIGNVQEKMGHRDDARAAYESALKLDPQNRSALEGLGRVK